MISPRVFKRALGRNAIALALALATVSALATDLEDGIRYYNSKDFGRAAIAFGKAAAQGDALAQFNLGLMYAKGRGVAQDYVQAAFWYEKAASQGYADAEFNLGVLFSDGTGVARNYAQPSLPI